MGKKKKEDIQSIWDDFDVEEEQDQESVEEVVEEVEKTDKEKAAIRRKRNRTFFKL